MVAVGARWRLKRLDTEHASGAGTGVATYPLARLIMSKISFIGPEVLYTT